MEQVLAAALHAAPGAPDACPAAGDLAAFLEGGLSGSERDAIERHATACDRCQQTLAIIGSSLPPTAADSPAWRAWLTVERLGWLVPAAAATAVVLYIAVTPVIAPRQTSKRARTGISLATTAQKSTAAPDVVSNQPAPPPPPAAPQSSAATAPRSTTAPPAASKPGRIRQAPASEIAAADADSLRALSGGRGRAPSHEPRVAQAAPSKTEIVASALPALPPAAAPAMPQAQFQLAPAGATVDQVQQQRKVAEAATDAPPRPIALTPAIVVAPGTAVRWRLDSGGRISRSHDSGVTWELLAYRAPSDIFALSAPTPTTCWLAGRAGLVVLTLDGERWERRPFPEAVDLIAIEARDGRHATVTARDGRRFATEDGGATWVVR